MLPMAVSSPQMKGETKMTKKEWIAKFNKTKEELGISKDQKIYTIKELDLLAQAMGCDRLHIMQYLKWGRI